MGARYAVDERVERVLANFEERARREDEVFSRLSPEAQVERRDEFLLCVGPATGALLNLLAREARAASILDVGVAYGYSTLWLAEAARANGGRVIGIDLSGEKLERAGNALDRAGLRVHVELRRGDAVELLGSSEESYDFVLLDIWKDLYISCFDALLARLRRGAIVVADNMLSPAAVALDALRYRKHLRLVSGVESVLLPVGSGLYLSRYRAP